ncbi:MAG: hypothetical protein LC130_25575 [Bryobacterales bacterium]|nr:hypothetical protein [Bryobacterales bacterium]
MQETAMTNCPAPAATTAGSGPIEAGCAGGVITPERIRDLIAGLEAPFDSAEIKWRVTNTAQVGGRSGPRLRGQMLAYADPRAYTDRLNKLFTPSGWTRDYAVLLVQNFERKERGSAERTIAAKIVVTCKVTIHGLGVHTGLGEEWADDDNSGTAAEAQAFKRACSCFGLGRYLYDLEGQWVDLDDRKRPLETPRLPDWARPSAPEGTKQSPASSRTNGSSQQSRNRNGAQRNGRGGLYRNELVAQVKTLCDTVGYSLARSVLQAVGKVDDPAEIRNVAALTTAFERLQDLARGVERLRVAVEKCGAQRYLAVCQTLNLASDSIDDIPDRPTLRRLLNTLEGNTGCEPAQPQEAVNGNGNRALNELRGRFLREAARVSGATYRTLADVVLEASNGSLTLAALKTLSATDSDKMQAALEKLEHIAV